MFTHYRTQGFILKKIDSGETDRIFTIYTKDFGKLELLAKAERKIKSKLRAGLEPFYLSEIEFIQGKTHKTLTDAILINSFKNLRKTLKRLSVAYKISEVIDNLVKGQEPDEKIWQLLTDVFEKLNNFSLVGDRLLLIYHYSLWNLFSILGYELELYHCSLCQKKLNPGDVYFSPKEGGLICQNCSKKVKSVKEADLATIKILRIILKKDWPLLSKLKIEKLHIESLAALSEDWYKSLVNSF